MREIPGKHRRLQSGPTSGPDQQDPPDQPELPGQPEFFDPAEFLDQPDAPDVGEAALRFATDWSWPVLPGAGPRVRHQHGRRGRPQERNAGAVRGPGKAHGATEAGNADAADPNRGVDRQRALGHEHRRSTGRLCACPDPECALPGAHPFEPGLLAATTDARMVRWWWQNRPAAPILLATGGRGPCAVSFPAAAGPATLAALDGLGKRLGPVVAGPERWAILVAPYDFERLGALLYAQDSVPGALRFHGSGGYLPLPPSVTGLGAVRWARAPLPGSARPWLPDVEAVVGATVATVTRTGVSAPEL
ncbi:bifunctional DNA primase/polymerase [Streptomyces sp. NPDC007088]|uniref:bifunctional DNA primase/polymerase n=1 Tax=Streptomyces sp. NPDC007088 TaxID=3364773 RepID=UPI0036D022C1